MKQTIILLYGGRSAEREVSVHFRGKCHACGQLRSFQSQDFLYQSVR